MRVRSLGREDPLEEEMVTPVFLLGKSPEQRRLVGCGLWGHKESDTTEHNNTAPYQFKYRYIYIVASKLAFGDALSLIPFCYIAGDRIGSQDT